MYRLTLLILVLLSTSTYGSEWKSLIANVAAAESKSVVTTVEVTADIAPIKLVEPKTTGLVRVSGPRHYGPHRGCMMCLGNHMIGTHGQVRSYLNTVGYNKWQVLHDNLHNGPDATVTKSVTRAKSTSVSTRRGLFSRWRTRSKSCANGQCGR